MTKTLLSVHVFSCGFTYILRDIYPAETAPGMSLFTRSFFCAYFQQWRPLFLVGAALPLLICSYVQSVATDAAGLGSAKASRSCSTLPGRVEMRMADYVPSRRPILRSERRQKESGGC